LNEAQIAEIQNSHKFEHNWCIVQQTKDIKQSQDFSSIGKGIQTLHTKCHTSTIPRRVTVLHAQLCLRSQLVFPNIFNKQHHTHENDDSYISLSTIYIPFIQGDFLENIKNLH
jgi:hypothetical protein